MCHEGPATWRSCCTPTCPSCATPSTRAPWRSAGSSRRSPSATSAPGGVQSAAPRRRSLRAHHVAHAAARARCCATRCTCCRALRRLPRANAGARRAGDDTPRAVMRAFDPWRSFTWSTSSRCAAPGSAFVATWWAPWLPTPDGREIDLIVVRCATHAYLPGLSATPRAVRAQLRVGMRAFEHAHRATPRGLWLPECAYSPEFDGEIAAGGVPLHHRRLARHQLGAPASPVRRARAHRFDRRGRFSSGAIRNRASKFGRRHEGYPGDAYYRDFYRDVGSISRSSIWATKSGPLWRAHA